MTNIEKYFKNKEVLGFVPRVTVDGDAKKIKVDFDHLDKKYLNALSSLTTGVVKEFCGRITQQYGSLPEEVLAELQSKKNEDLQRYMEVLLTHGEEAFQTIVEGTIKIAKHKAFYNGIIYDENHGWLYHNQKVNL